MQLTAHLPIIVWADVAMLDSAFHPINICGTVVNNGVMMSSMTAPPHRRLEGRSVRDWLLLAVLCKKNAR